MKLNYIEIENLLSFGTDPQRVDFDSGTTVLIGPNGGGKTNVVRALELMRNLMHPPVGNHLIEIPPHRNHLASKSSVTLAMNLDSDDERDLIALFIAGYVAHSLGNHSSQARTSNDQAAIATKALELGREFASGIGDFCLVARNDRRVQSAWVTEARFTINGVSYSYALSDPYRYQQVFAGELFQTEHLPFKVGTSAESLSDELNSVSPEKWSLGAMLPESEERLNLVLDNAFNYDPDLKSNLLRSGIIDDSVFRITVTLRRVLGKIMSRALRIDLNDDGFGSPVTYDTDPLKGSAVPTVAAASSVMTDLYQWKMGDLETRRRLQRAQGIFQELRGTGETFDLRASLAAVSDSSNQADTPSQRLTLEPVVVSVEGDSEVPAKFAGSGATDLIKLSTYLVADEATVVVLDEPGARLHPTAQARLLKFLNDSQAQNIVISHSPNLFPRDKVGRIALDQRGESQITMVSLTKQLDLPALGATLKNETRADQRSAVRRQLLKDPILRSIPFAEAVIFVSGYTEAIAYQDWFEAWRDSLNKQDAAEHRQRPSCPRDVAFINFLGDNNFVHYLRVADVFGIPWAMIADGNSYRPEGGCDELKFPLVAKQIKEACDGFNNDIDTIELCTEKCDAKKNYDWFKTWKDSLERLGVFSQATCWKSKAKKTADCARDGCSQRWYENTGSCDKPEWHADDSPHVESFEDFCDNDPELSKIASGQNRNDKIQQAFALLDAHPDCPKAVATLFDRISRCWQQKAATLSATKSG